MIEHLDVDVFCGELLADALLIPESIIRVNKTRVITRDPMFHDLYFFASYLRKTDIVRLKVYCGSLWVCGDPAWNKKTYALARVVSETVEKAAKACGLEIRGGGFAPDANGKE